MGEEGSVTILDHQVGVTWPAGRSDGLIISLNLAGDLTYLMEGTQRPQKVVQGHLKNITAVDIDRDSNTLWTGSSDGRVCSWDTAIGTGHIVGGAAHTNYVSGISISSDGTIYSVGWDDALRSLDSTAKTFTGGSQSTDGQPKGIATVGKQAIVATHKCIEIFTEGKKTGEVKTKFSPSSIAASGKLVAVGGDDHVLHIFGLLPGSLSLQKDIPEPASLTTTLSFSPDGKMLAVGFANGKITVYNCTDWAIGITRWSSHTGRITKIAWNKSGTFAVSGALDGNIFIWSVAKPGMRVNVPNAHKEGVNGVSFFDNHTKVVSVGFDACVKTWKVEGLP
jgi:WD40 repeat protein